MQREHDHGAPGVEPGSGASAGPGPDRGEQEEAGREDQEAPRRARCRRAAWSRASPAPRSRAATCQGRPASRDWPDAPASEKAKTAIRSAAVHERLPDALERHGHVVEAEKALPRRGTRGRPRCRGRRRAAPSAQRDVERDRSRRPALRSRPLRVAGGPRTRAGATARDQRRPAARPFPAAAARAWPSSDATIAAQRSPPATAVLAMRGRPHRTEAESFARRSSPGWSTVSGTTVTLRRSRSGSRSGSRPACTSTSDDGPVRKRSLHERVREPGRQRSRHDDELDRLRRGRRVAREEGLDAFRPGRLDRLPGARRASCHSPSNDVTRLYSGGLVVTASSARLPRKAWTRRIEPAARTWTSKLSATAVCGVGVEQHGHLVVRRVLELLDHQAAPSRRRLPVHLAQRLALLRSRARCAGRSRSVGAAGAGRPSCARAPASEKSRSSSHEPRVDEQRAAPLEPQLGAARARTDPRARPCARLECGSGRAARLRSTYAPQQCSPVPARARTSPLAEPLDRSTSVDALRAHGGRPARARARTGTSSPSDVLAAGTEPRASAIGPGRERAPRPQAQRRPRARGPTATGYSGVASRTPTPAT